MLPWKPSLVLLADGKSFSDSGVCGNFVHFAFIIFFVGSAFLIFLYLWKKGKLDMDEEPKIRMMEEDAEGSKKDPVPSNKEPHE
jgi:hypothetical protein